MHAGHAEPVCQDSAAAREWWASARTAGRFSATDRSRARSLRLVASMSPEPFDTEAMVERAPSNPAHQPGRVVGIDGIVFQCDADDAISSLIIRPIQELSLRFQGRPRRADSWGVPLANHAGIRVRIAGADGRAHLYVVEQLNGTLVQNVANALSWTPWRDFKLREGRGGWHVTVPATAFEGLEPADVLAAI